MEIYLLAGLIVLTLGALGNMYRPVVKLTELDMLQHLHKYYKRKRNKEASMLIESLIRIMFK